MQVHGGPFQVVAVDGDALAPSAHYLADTVNFGPGQRYDVIWTARRPGKWLVHCHIPHHTTNNNVERHLQKSAQGRVTRHHRFLLRLHLTQIDALDVAIAKIDREVEAGIAPFRYRRRASNLGSGRQGP
jgi:hypothetical protein